jgi:2-polyprenyl-3-methyl-5-hydroxy-6-metoxy-1,4-benzoquinol methylase
MSHAQNNTYLLRRLEEASGYYASSFSFRYMNWKRHRSIEEAVGRELVRLKRSGQESFKILDLGCGDGAVLYRLKARFDPVFRVHYTGVDLSPLDIDFARERKAHFDHKNCDFILADILKADIAPEAFDIIINTEVIEHVPEPAILVDRMRGLLKKDGLLILTTPHEGGGALARLLRVAKRSLLGGRVRRERVALDARVVHGAEKFGARFGSAGGRTGAGEDHVSVMKRAAWARLFIRRGFRISSMRGTAGLLFGEPLLDQHRVLFAVCVILDAMLEILPWSYLWSECLFFELRKIRVS